MTNLTPRYPHDVIVSLSQAELMTLRLALEDSIDYNLKESASAETTSDADIYLNFANTAKKLHDQIIELL